MTITTKIENGKAVHTITCNDNELINMTETFQTAISHDDRRYCKELMKLHEMDSSSKAYEVQRLHVSILDSIERADRQFAETLKDEAQRAHERLASWFDNQ